MPAKQAFLFCWKNQLNKCYIQAQPQTQTFTKQHKSSHDVNILTKVGGATESRDELHPMKVESMAKEEQEMVLRKRNYIQINS